MTKRSIGCAAAPYYEDELITLYHADATTIPALWATADILVTDPPYGMRFQSRWTKNRRLDNIRGDTDTTAREKILTAWEEFTPDRPAIIFGTWRVPPPPGERQRLIWHKKDTAGMGDLRMPWGSNFEEIYVLGHGWDVKKTCHKRMGSVIETRGVRGGAQGDENKYGHPTPKPVRLMEELIKRCPPGVIADPFAGAGATLRAAKNLGRRAIGVEIEEKYCEVIAKRLSQEMLMMA